MNLFFQLALVFCFASLGIAAPIGGKTKENVEQLDSLRLYLLKNTSSGEKTLHRKKSEPTTSGRRIRSIVARRRTTSRAQEVGLKDSALNYIEENYADLTKFKSKDFEQLYTQLGYK